MNLTIDLNGTWDFYADENESIISLSFDELPETIPWKTAVVPGCWEAEGISKLFSGPAWYRKEFILPEQQEAGCWLLKFEAVSYCCEIYVNGKEAGCHEGMWDSFYFDVTGLVNIGQSNTLAVKVFKPGYNLKDRFYYRETLTGFIPDVASTFGGIWGSVKLERKVEIYIESCHVEAHIHESKAKICAVVCNTKNIPAVIELDAYVTLDEGKRALSSKQLLLTPGTNFTEINVVIENLILWDTDNPFLYSGSISVKSSRGSIDTVPIKFGMREIRSQGSEIFLNGKPLYIRGILHWGYYPESICPIPDREAIAAEISKAKAMGFNTVKHCLYIPVKEYYRIADEMGMLVWQELPVWLPRTTPEFRKRMREQYPRIVRQLAGHPSLIIYTLGCEMDAGVDGEVLEELYNTVKHIAGNVLVRDNSGSGECYEGLAVDYADFYDYHFYTDLQNIEGLMDVFTPGWRDTRPWLYGEFCDSDTYRDTRMLHGMLKQSELWWLSGAGRDNPLSTVVTMPVLAQGEILRENGIENESEVLHEISLKQSLLHRKFIVEAVRRYPQINGYVITCMRDVPITTSGLFDDFMQPKFSSEEFRLFNSDIVLTQAWDLGRIWVNGGDRVLDRDRYNYWAGEHAGMHIVLSNYGKKQFVNLEADWQVSDDGGNVLYKGHKKAAGIFMPGSVKELIILRFRLPEAEKACGLWVDVSVGNPGKIACNRWRIWVYPKKFSGMTTESIALYDPFDILGYLRELYSIKIINDFDAPIDADIVIATGVTPALKEYLEKGGSVFYIQRGNGYFPERKCPFWREAVKRLYDHEVLKEFPHSGFTDLQFFGLAADTSIDTLKLNCGGIRHINPIIRRVDARNFSVSDYLVEFKIGEGTMIASTLRFEGGMGRQPSSLKENKAGIFLIDRILRYLKGERKKRIF